MLATFIPVMLIDRYGRRLLHLISVTAVTAALLLLATLFYFINRFSIPTVAVGDTLGGYDFFTKPLTHKCMGLKSVKSFNYFKANSLTV